MRNKPIERCHGGNGNTSRIFVEDSTGHALSHEDNVPEIQTEPASTRVKRTASSSSVMQTVKSAPQPQTRLTARVQERESVQTMTPSKQSYGMTTMTTMVKSSQMDYSWASQRRDSVPEETPKPRNGTSTRTGLQELAQIDPIKRTVNPNATVGGGQGEASGDVPSSGGGGSDEVDCVQSLNGLTDEVTIVVDDEVVQGAPALNEFYKFVVDGQKIRLVKVKDTILSLNALDRNVTIDGKIEGGIKVETKEEGRRIELSAYWV